MKKWLALFLFFVFSFDVVFDGLDARCQDLPSSQQCHACVCQFHATNPKVTVVYKVSDANLKCCENNQDDFSERLFDKSLFHPPKLLA